MKKRGFEVISEYKDKGINLPVRKTKYSAGYDVEAAEDVLIPAYRFGTKPTLVPTGLKAYCENDEFYMLVNRSSGPKKGLIIPNSIGIIDADYYNNENNEGHFYFQFFNISGEDLLIKKGDVIGQVIFQKYLITDDDHAEGIRSGGFGSTDEK